MKKSTPFRLKAIAAATTLGLAINAGAVTLTVTNSLDSGAGSLRAALTTISLDSVCSGSPYLVNFNIGTPPAGPIVLQPASPLPAINCTTTIAGYTQPGSTPNTLGALDGSNAAIRIVVDGVNATGAVYGLNLSGASSIVQGLSVVNFVNGPGILATASGSRVIGSFVGVFPDGTPGGNLRGIDFNFSNGEAGGLAAGDRNVVSANLTQGIKLGFGGLARNNVVGVAPNGITASGNGQMGISANLDGGTITGNRIANNQKGIVSFSNFNANWGGNEIYGNSLIGVDLCNDGPNPNDPLDGDFGTPNPCNGLQNSAVITGVTFTTTATTFTATLNTNPGSTGYSVAFYGNDDALGQAKFPTACSVGAIATDASGNNTSPISVLCPGTHPNPTAIVTGPQGSSEISAPFLTPDALVSPAAATFGSVAVGGSSAVTPVTITNNGLGPMNISSFTVLPAGEFTDTNGTPANLWCGLGPTATGLVTLAPTQSCTLNLVFAPQASGTRSAALTVGTGSTVPGVGDPFVPLSGLGTVANVVATASFGAPSIIAGTATPFTLNLLNSNLQSYELSSYTVTLPSGVPSGIVVAPGPVASVGAPCSGSVIASPGIGSFDLSGLVVPAGTNCNISVAVTSTTPASYTYTLGAGGLTGGLLIPSGAAVSNTATSASLTVNPALAPALGVSPLSVTFPNTTVGILSAPIGVTVTNTGTAPLTFSGPITVGAPFAVANGCPVSPATLAVSASCNLNVTFQPAVPGAQTGVLSIASDGGTQSVSLAGTGQVIPPSVNFGFTPLSVIIGSPSALQMTIGNANGAPFSNPTFTFNLPPGLEVAASPNATNPITPCSGGFVAPSPGATSFTVNSLSVPTSGSCAFSIALTSAASGTYNVSMAAGGIVGSVLTQTGVGNAASNTASLVVTAVPSPVLSISPPPPGPLAFGNVTVGSFSAFQTVTLTNAGNAPLTFSGSVVASSASTLKVSPTVTGEFVVNTATATPCPATLPAAPGPGNSCTIEVKFEPTVVGPATGTLGISSDGGSATLNLTGTGDPVPAPAVSLSASGLTFASQMVGTVSSPQLVLLDNVGTAPLTLSAITTGGDFAHSTTCPFAPSTIPANSGCDITVTFTPLLPGGRTGTMSISSDASGSPHQVALSGTGTAAPVPAVSVLPSPVTFPTTQVGTTSSPVSVTVTNTGGVPLAVSVVEIVGGGFSITSNGCTTTVAAGADCIVTLVFAPPSAGTITATLRLISNAPASPTLVALSGTGSAAAVASLSASPASLSFGERAIGTTSPAQSVTLANTGGATATIASLTVTGDYAQTNNCASVPPDGSCTITVTFTPTAAGSRPGSIVVAGDASNAPLTIALTGSGAPPAEPVIELSVTSLSYGNTLVGAATGAQVVTVRNAGGAPLAISSLDLRGEFSVANGCTTPIAPGDTCRLDVGFRPIIPGSRLGRLDVLSNASNGTKGVDLAGTGCRFSFLNRSLTLLCQ